MKVSGQTAQQGWVVRWGSGEAGRAGSGRYHLDSAALVVLEQREQQRVLGAGRARARARVRAAHLQQRARAVVHRHERALAANTHEYDIITLLDLVIVDRRRDKKNM